MDALSFVCGASKETLRVTRLEELITKKTIDHQQSHDMTTSQTETALVEMCLVSMDPASDLSYHFKRSVSRRTTKGKTPSKTVVTSLFAMRQQHRFSQDTPVVSTSSQSQSLTLPREHNASGWQKVSHTVYLQALCQLGFNMELQDRFIVRHSYVQ